MGQDRHGEGAREVPYVALAKQVPHSALRHAPAAQRVAYWVWQPWLKGLRTVTLGGMPMLGHNTVRF